ncbi:hypothetical protein [Amygdalobacter nucleatus]|uniref:hypothetical protein n=1 Tax=Amygdalobacter nucleatus TaxID=3029274 RepID=UPI0027AB4CA1|nr:hypothetical protein [Amygdalobacter nucleatus]WEG36944.1 hypothetical protein PYS63_00420 [Amygdalobacter nucleatus]
MHKMWFICCLFGLQVFNLVAYFYIRHKCGWQYNFYSELAALRKSKYVYVWFFLLSVNIGLVLLVVLGLIHFGWLLSFIIIMQTIDVLLFVRKRIWRQ